MENENQGNEIINDKLDELKITQFELDDEDKKKTQELFHYVLTHIIDEYNKLNKKQREERGIYYMKDKHILLANINEEYIQSYINYKVLFKGLLIEGKARFFPEFDENKVHLSRSNRNRYNKIKCFTSNKTNNSEPNVNQSINSDNNNKNNDKKKEKKH